MAYPLYLLILAIAPGIIWLLYFLKKDVHPEPRHMILKVFFWGMFSALPAAIIEIIFKKIFPENIYFINELGCYFIAFLSVVVGVAMVEEILKFLVIKGVVLKSSELDEPMDLVLYMIIAGLGFATLENIFIFFSSDIFFYPSNGFECAAYQIISFIPNEFVCVFFLAFMRFISATFLHALCSGIIGFFLALSLCEAKRKKSLLFFGFAIAILLHGLYNFSIMELGGIFKFGIPSIIIASLAIFNLIGIKRLKKLKGICKI
jgi:RsiW-degrading membrane proteinase PrsW (M82 family)